MGSEEPNFTQLVYGNYNAVAGTNSTAIVNVFPNIQATPPVQKPSRPQNFTGRLDEIDFLLSSLKTNKVITVSGTAGIGKTALVSELVWQLAPNQTLPEDFPDGILYHNFYSQPKAATALESFSLSFGELPRPNPFLAAQRVLANRHVLAILDSFEDCDEPNQILDVFSESGIIVISRLRKNLGDKHLDVLPLKEDDSIKLLTSFVGKKNKKDLETIIYLLGGAPYAICLTGRYLAETQEDISLFAARLSQEPIKVLSETETTPENLSTFLERSIACLSNNARNMLTMLGMLDFEHPNIKAVSYALSFSEHQTAATTSELVRYGIIQRQKNKMSLSNRLLHFYIKTQFEPNNKQTTRLAEYFKTFFHAYKDNGVLDIEYKNIILTVNKSVTQELWLQVQQLTWSLLEFLDRRGLWTEKISMASAGHLASTKLLDNKKAFKPMVALMTPKIM